MLILAQSVGIQLHWIGSPCSGLSRPLAAAPPHALQRHTPSGCICFSPRLWAGLPTPFFKSWPWLVPRYALVADAPGLRVLGGSGARSHAGQSVRFPRSARPTTPTHGNKLMLPIRAGTTKRQRWWPSVTGVKRELA